MTTKEINQHYLTYINDSNEDNYHSLLQACLAITKQYMSVHPKLSADHDDIC
jgi:hypothetical protein